MPQAAARRGDKGHRHRDPRSNNHGVEFFSEGENRNILKIKIPYVCNYKRTGLADRRRCKEAQHSFSMPIAFQIIVALIAPTNGTER